MTNQNTLPSGRYTGWRPSPIDSRDYVTQLAGPNEVAIEVDSAPREYSPTDTPPIDNQAELGACTANASTRAIRYAFIQAGVDPGPLSRLWAYAQTRFLEGGWAQFKEDSGAYGRDDFKVGRKQGMILESAWSYDDYATTFNDMETFLAAKKVTDRYFIDNYSRPSTDFDTFQAVLSSKKIIIFGFPVYQSFESEATAASGIVTVPGRGERILGGHEMAFEGYVYKSGVRYWKAANNWDVTWGDNGYCYFPDSYMFKYGMSDYRVVDSVKLH